MARRGAVLLVLLSVAGCGRLGFAPAQAGDASDAAPVDAATPAPIHRYRLNNSYSDDYGGQPLISLGGNFSGDGFRFVANEGLGLSNAMPVSVYTIDIELAFDELSSWRKILDFKSLKEDSGLYVLDAKLTFVELADPPNYVSSAPLLVAAVPFEVTLSRGADGTVVGYVNRSMQFSITDSLGAGTFTDQGAFADFAIDDTATSQQEASPGEIREIRIWDVALTASQVGEL